MALDQDLDAAVTVLKTYNALASPTAAQQTAHIKALSQIVARLIFARQYHPQDTP